VPDYVGWLVQRKSTKKKTEPQVHFFILRPPLPRPFSNGIHVDVHKVVIVAEFCVKTHQLATTTTPSASSVPLQLLHNHSPMQRLILESMQQPLSAQEDMQDMHRTQLGPSHHQPDTPH